VGSVHQGSRRPNPRWVDEIAGLKAAVAATRGGQL
jgi:hypothetical protein